MNTFVLIHGAWHGAWCWYRLVPLLRKEGNTVIALDLPSHGTDKTPTGLVTLQAYTDSVCRVLDAQTAPVILVGHSMGGIVISQAAEARPQKIKSLVYLTAFLLKDGQSLLDVAQADTEAQVLPNLVFSDDRSSAVVNEERRKSIFYVDCSDEDVTLAQSLLVPQAVAPFATPVRTTRVNWGRIPRLYVECTRDTAISLTSQRHMQKSQPCDRVLTLETGHSPFFSAPGEVARFLLSV